MRTIQQKMIASLIAGLGALIIITGGYPVIADDGYLDGGFMGIPSWVYVRIDPTVMNNIIGTVHGHTLFDEPLFDPSEKMRKPVIFQKNRWLFEKPDTSRDDDWIIGGPFFRRGHTLW